VKVMAFRCEGMLGLKYELLAKFMRILMLSICMDSATNSHHKTTMVSRLKATTNSHPKSATPPRSKTATPLLPFI